MSRLFRVMWKGQHSSRIVASGGPVRSGYYRAKIRVELGRLDPRLSRDPTPRIQERADGQGANSLGVEINLSRFCANSDLGIKAL